MSVEDLQDRKERPAYVQFETRTTEDKAASAAQGRYVTREFDVAKITPPYSKDSIEFKVSNWLSDIEKNLRDGRIPEEWAEYWRESYKRWKAGQELPLSGTPIKGWGVISLSQQENLIHVNCKTVEDLAAVNEEGMRRMGMGALDLRNKARAWLESMKNHGGVTLKVSALEQENSVLKTSVESLQKKVEEMQALLQAHAVQGGAAPIDDTASISASDLLDDPVPAKRRGRPPQQAVAAS